MNFRRVSPLILLVLAASVVLVACGGSESSSTPTAQKQAEQKLTGTTPTGSTGSSKPKKASPKPAPSSTQEGQELFASNGCGSCHTLAAAGASGAIGPDLDQELPGQSVSVIEQSITDPGAKITSGYSAGIMPTSFGSTLSKSQVSALANFLVDSTSK